MNLPQIFSEKKVDFTRRKKLSEPVEKLQPLEKTMILSQFASRDSDQSPVPEHILECSRARGWGGKMTQKGVSAMRWSFATGSTDEFFPGPVTFHDLPFSQAEQDDEDAGDDIIP